MANVRRKSGTCHVAKTCQDHISSLSHEVQTLRRSWVFPKQWQNI